MNKIKMKKIWSSKTVKAFRINRMSNKIWYKSKGSSNIQIKNISKTWISKTLISISKTCGISSSKSPSKNPNLINKMFKLKNNPKPLNKKYKRHLKINNFPINSNKSALVCLATWPSSKKSNNKSENKWTVCSTNSLTETSWSLSDSSLKFSFQPRRASPFLFSSISLSSPMFKSKNLISIFYSVIFLSPVHFIISSGTDSWLLWFMKLSWNSLNTRTPLKIMKKSKKLVIADYLKKRKTSLRFYLICMTSDQSQGNSSTLWSNIWLWNLINKTFSFCTL